MKKWRKETGLILYIRQVLAPYENQSQDIRDALDSIDVYLSSIKFRRESLGRERSKNHANDESNGTGS